MTKLYGALFCSESLQQLEFLRTALCVQGRQGNRRNVETQRDGNDSYQASYQISHLSLHSSIHALCMCLYIIYASNVKILKSRPPIYRSLCMPREMTIFLLVQFYSAPQGSSTDRQLKCTLKECYGHIFNGRLLFEREATAGN